ncbi:GNAT family N-acetyltransferase [Shewanella youngdeokensis]|uniref:N-acetyltransferase n=1 Tax=Shewanella youngdeokensis TaxID=2999068 RepID=A0ABZ0JZV0_9GAMM|nr:N-acetyltransferase [Shewanella sp. DAU334]
MSINIRLEKSGDIQSIHDVTTAAFLNAPHTDHTEQFIIDALRASKALSISLVAELNSNIVGHVALSPVTISDGAHNWYGLGPISVVPTEQGKGVGTELMHAAIEALTKRNANGCVLLGDPHFYGRFGFEPKAGLLLADVPAEYFQALLLQGACPKGYVTYHESFAAKG